MKHQGSHTSDFKKAVAALDDRLYSLVGAGIRYEQHPVRQHINLALKAHSDGERAVSFSKAASIQFLAEDLEKVKLASIEAYKDFKKKLNDSDLPFDQYIGIRREVRFAAGLVDKKLKFKKTETPDFLINENEFIFGAECSSAHIDFLREISGKSLVYKVEAILKKKSASDYKQKHNILIVDITNLLFHEGKSSKLELAEKDFAAKVLSPSVDSSAFQSLLAFSMANEDLGPGKGVTLHDKFYRIDRSDINSKIKSFLDRFYPLGSEYKELLVFKYA